MDYIRQVAPEATKFAIETGAKYDGKTLEDEGVEYLLENTPDFLGTASFGGFIERDFMIPYYKETHDKGCYLVCAAGNGEGDVHKLADGDMWKAIGACKLNFGGSNNYPTVKIERDFSKGEEMDYVGAHNLKATYDSKKHEGTSFAYPLFMGMLALVQSFFIKNTGKKLTHEQLNRFVIDNCMDICEEGRDNESGYGLFILPDPTTIDICKYTDSVIVDISEQDKNTKEEFIMPNTRYRFLRDIPEGEFHDVISYLIDMDILKGRSGEGEDTEVDLSEDMVRMFVINFRSGLYDV